MARCFVCDNDLMTSESARDFDGYKCGCLRCGAFTIEREFVEAMKGSSFPADERLALSCAIRQATDEHKALHERIDVKNDRAIADRARGTRHPLDLIDVFVLALAQQSDRIGAPTRPQHMHAWAARARVPGFSELSSFCYELHKMGLIQSAPNMQGSGENYQLTLTVDGWKEARRLEKEHGPGNQAFIAMWFDKRLDDAFDTAFLPAFERVGYKAYRVDRDPHDQRIDNQIVAEIRRSRILVAECTGARPAVYFEAGLAYGLGLEVIWCCHSPKGLRKGTPAFKAPAPRRNEKAWFDQLSFDTRQYVCHQWATLDQLKDTIINRVRARGLDLKRE